MTPDEDVELCQNVKKRKIENLNPLACDHSVWMTVIMHFYLTNKLEVVNVEHRGELGLLFYDYDDKRYGQKTR